MQRFQFAETEEVRTREDDEPALPLVGATALCFLLTFLGAFILFGL